MVVIRKKVIWYYKQQRRGFFVKIFFSVLQNKIGGKFSLKLHVSFLMLPHLPLKCEKNIISKWTTTQIPAPCESCKGGFLRLFQYVYSFGMVIFNVSACVLSYFR